MACCFGSAACSLCCTVCPSARNSTTTRVMYSLMLLVGMLISCFMLSQWVQQKLAKVCVFHQIFQKKKFRTVGFAQFLILAIFARRSQATRRFIGNSVFSTIPPHLYSEFAWEWPHSLVFSWS